MGMRTHEIIYIYIFFIKHSIAFASEQKCWIMIKSDLLVAFNVVPFIIYSIILCLFCNIYLFSILNFNLVFWFFIEFS